MHQLALSAAQVSAVLKRLEYSEAIIADLATLKKLHAASVAKIPFETLDVFIGKKFFLTLSDLYDKIVVRKRGGGCYELNGLFYHLLRALGFDVSICNAHLYDAKQALILDSQHMVLIVKLNGFWLVDVGYGNGFAEPLFLDRPEMQKQGDRVFRCLDENSRYIVQEKEHGSWISWYALTKAAKTIEDFEERNWFHQTNRESVFFGKRICMLAKGDETIELLGNVLVRKTSSGIKRTIIEEKDISQILQTEFGIQIGESSTLYLSL